LRALYTAIMRRVGSDTLSFILATHFAQGFEEAKDATEEERADVLRGWENMKPNLEKEKSETSTVSSGDL